jgi:fructokinase
MIVGIETGGTKTVCALAEAPFAPDPSYEPASVVRFATTSPTQTMQRIAAFVGEQRDRGRLDAIGIGSFGPVDLDPRSQRWGTIGETPKPGWSGTRLLDPIRHVTDAPVTIETDVAAAAIAELRWGVGRTASGAAIRDLSYVTVGTGVGVGAIVDGRTLHGTAHPEIGHLTVRRHPDDDFPGVCRLHGDCLEGLACGPALLGRWGRPGEALGDRQPEAVAMESYYLAQLVAALVYLLSPGVVLLGGGVMATPGLLEAVRTETARLVGTALGEHPVRDPRSGFLTRPALGDRAGVIGALTMASDLLEPTS